MKKFLLVILSFTFSLGLMAQQEKSIRKAYTVSTGETILSFGILKAKPLETSTVARFTPFFNFGQQIHFDFSDKFGIYTGLNLRNVGLINDLNDSIRIKQRTYNLGIPIAFKVGDMERFNLAAGFEAEFAIAYKQKVYVNGEKRKSNSWFDDRTNIFLPSVFVEFKNKEGNFIRFKYYVSDYLKTNNQKINVPGVEYRPTSSQLFYVSVGYAIRNRDF